MKNMRAVLMIICFLRLYFPRRKAKHSAHSFLTEEDEDRKDEEEEGENVEEEENKED